MTAMKKWLESTTKQLVWWLIINGTIWIYLSYILAYLGRDDIAETLSRAVVTEVIGTMAVYCIKAAVENVFKNNTFSWSRKKSGGSNRDMRDY